MIRILAMLSVFLLAVPAHASDPAVTVFTDVHVLTMTDGGNLGGATVVVEGDRIISVSQSDDGIPAGARIVDGSGRTLMPGLADMHVHYWSATEGPLFLANSVTAVRNLWGSKTTFVLDAGAKNGQLVGPHIYTSGPLMDGPEPIWGEASIQLTSAEQAVGAVESQRATGYTAVKLYEGLTAEIYTAAVTAAQERDMQVWTHVPGVLTVEEVFAHGVDSIEHFEGISTAATTAPADAKYMARWAAADRGRLQQLAALSAEAGVWQSPTMAVISKRFEYAGEGDAWFGRPEAAYVGPGLQQWWRSSAERMGPYDDEKRAAAANQQAFLSMLYDVDAPLLIGTDTPNPFVIPGFAIHDELAAFVAAGIPVEDVLRIATADAARFLREDGEWGVVAENARADLVLLDADPREDLTTLRRPLGVMVNGHWYDGDRLAGELAGIRRQHEEAAAEQDGDAEPAD